MSSSPSKVVSTMMRAPGHSSRIFEIASAPPSFGSRRSISVTSGVSLRNVSTASRPSAASETTARSGTVFSSATSPCRTTVWSSTTMIRIGSLISPQLSFSFICRYFNTYARALALPAAHCQCAANLFGAFLHARNAKVSVLRRGRLAAEAAAIILNAQLNPPAGELQVNLHPPGAGMPHGIGHSLLRNAHQLALHLLGQRTILAIHTHLGADIGPRRHPVGHLRQPRGKVAILGALRTQLPDCVTRICKAALDQILRLRKMLPGRLRRAADQPRNDLQLDGHRNDSLCQRVMNLARDAIALRHHRMESRLHLP